LGGVLTATKNNDFLVVRQEKFDVGLEMSTTGIYFGGCRVCVLGRTTTTGIREIDVGVVGEVGDSKETSEDCTCLTYP
jgi:hypothetical protein